LKRERRKDLGKGEARKPKKDLKSLAGMERGAKRKL